MRETWRWYGPDDPVTLPAIAETGAAGVVTALYHVHPDTAWEVEDVRALKARIEAAGLTWDVVESIPVPNAVKTGGAGWEAGIDTFCRSLRAVGAAGIGTVCYNFMPTFDWTRTRTDWRTRTGLATRYDHLDFAVYDLFVLRRPGAERSYTEAEVAAAAAAHAAAAPADLDHVERTIRLGIPGYLGVRTREDILAQIARFDGIGQAELAANLDAFIAAVVPVAEEAGVNLGLHPDDPPFPVFGLPRVVSTGEDLARILAAHDSPRHGLTFCTGSLGARPGNDTVALFERFAARVNFLHLRNVRIDGDRAFFEDTHLEGETDMAALISRILREERRRRAEGRADAEIPMRPDHGHLNERDAGMGSPHGYSYIGRLKGLAELRGVVAGVLPHLEPT
jgi:mannonate dehydratase